MNVCVPYLLMVYNFFMYAMQTPEDSHNIRPPRSPQPHPHKPLEDEISPDGALPLDRPSSPITNGTLTFSGRFRQPEIVLFAEPTQKHSKVLVCKVRRKRLKVTLKTNNHIVYQYRVSIRI